MKQRRILPAALCSAGIMFLILDSKTAFQGAVDGIGLCTSVIVPSLLPFFLLCPILSSICIGAKSRILNALEKLCGMPRGSGSLFLIGMIGGYPTGASTIHGAYKSGSLNRNDAERMMGFCCNAGPGFLFGVLGSVFERMELLWIIWGTHLLSAVLVAVLLPRRNANPSSIPLRDTLPFTAALNLAIRNIASVCGWVILMRILISFCKRWFLWLLSEEVQVLIVGLMELTNGCCDLYSVSIPHLQYMLANVFLSFGGVCVFLQTVSVTPGLGTGMYFPGKILQALISLGISAIIQPLLFPGTSTLSATLSVILLLLPVLTVMVLILRKKQ